VPFTLSHPAAILPLTRSFSALRPLVLSALIVGSITPDIQYFTSYPNLSRFSHTLPGVFIFCVPVGLLLLWTFHRVVKLPLVSLMPAGQQPYLVAASSEFSSAAVPGDVIVHVTGAGTDAPGLGCSDSRGREVLQPLRSPRCYLQAWRVCRGYMYDVLQHGGTLVGVVAMVLWYGLVAPGRRRNGHDTRQAPAHADVQCQAQRLQRCWRRRELAVFYARARSDSFSGLPGIYQWLVLWTRAALAGMLALFIRNAAISLFWTHCGMWGGCLQPDTQSSRARGIGHQASSLARWQEVDTVSTQSPRSAAVACVIVAHCEAARRTA
jgi:hypothetical protein